MRAVLFQRPAECTGEPRCEMDRYQLAMSSPANRPSVLAASVLCRKGKQGPIKSRECKTALLNDDRLSVLLGRDAKNDVFHIGVARVGHFMDLTRFDQDRVAAVEIACHLTDGH